jgi:hypothetical protein
MKLAINGRASCGQKSRHINIRFFFIKDRLKTEHIKMTHCPTEAMLADFFTKPLQGHLFTKFQRVLMGHAHINTLGISSIDPTEERVENNENNVEENSAVGAKSEILRAPEESIEQGDRVPVDEKSTVSTDSSEEGWTVVQGSKNKKRTLKSETKDSVNARAAKSSHSLELIQLLN